MRFMPGEVLYRIGDLSSVWLIADVFEQDLGLVRQGQPAKIRVDAYPGREFDGKVSFVYPTFTAETRTAKVRVELSNPGGALKPAMYAQVEIAAARGDAKTLSVPDSAVLDTGTRQVVLVRRGEGLFEPRPVKLGMRADGYVQVLEGLGEGENVVVSANFLIDAESNLKAALGAFAAPAAASKPSGGGAPAPGDGARGRRRRPQGALRCLPASSNGRCATSSWCCSAPSSSSPLASTPCSRRRSTRSPISPTCR
jgi:Cu(I)/Ag(I) efflux system membrane fusion protein